MQVNCLHLDKYIYVMKFKFSLILQDTKIFFLFEKVAKALFWFSFESIVVLACVLKLSACSHVDPNTPK